MSGQASSAHYCKWVACHVFANLVDLSAVFYINFVLQVSSLVYLLCYVRFDSPDFWLTFLFGRNYWLVLIYVGNYEYYWYFSYFQGTFLTLVPNLIGNLQRDPALFSDLLSTTFIPFARCQIAPSNLVIDKTELNFGCHLPLMELYEKIFIVAWAVLAVHWIWSFFMVVWLSLGMFPFFGKFSCVMTLSFVRKRSATYMYKAARICSLGEVHVLYLMKRYMSSAQFEELLVAFVSMKEEYVRQLKLNVHWNSGIQDTGDGKCRDFTSIPMVNESGFKESDSATAPPLQQWPWLAPAQTQMDSCQPCEFSVRNRNTKN